MQAEIENFVSSLTTLVIDSSEFDDAVNTLISDSVESAVTDAISDENIDGMIEREVGRQLEYNDTIADLENMITNLKAKIDEQADTISDFENEVSLLKFDIRFLSPKVQQLEQAQRKSTLRYKLSRLPILRRWISVEVY
jgi:predicted RNase H-like nuclease (RuvC/YqgF family)